MAAFSSADMPLLSLFHVRCKSAYATASSSAAFNKDGISIAVINDSALSAAPLSLSFLRWVYAAAILAAAEPMEAPIAAAAPPPGVGCLAARFARKVWRGSGPDAIF